MKKWTRAVLALAVVLALSGPRLARAQDESASEAPGVQGVSAVPDLSASMPLNQVSGLQSQVAAGLGSYLDDLMPPAQARGGQAVEAKAVSAYLAQNVSAQAPRSYAGSVLVESLADPAVAQRAATALSARPEHGAVAQRLLDLSAALHKNPAEWKGKLQRLQVLRRQSFSAAGNSQATASRLLDLFDGANAELPKDIPQPPASARHDAFAENFSHGPAASEDARPVQAETRAASFKMSPVAERELDRVPKGDQEAIARRIQALEEEPRPHGVKKLKDKGGLYRIRIGHWRVIYSIDAKTGAVLILNVLRRSEATYSGI